MKKLDKLYFDDYPLNLTMMDFINQSKNFTLNNSLNQNILFYEFSLSELGLPGAEELLRRVSVIRDQIGFLEPWKKNNVESDFYKGFSLTYNKSYIYPNQSIYGQTFGDYNLVQTFSKDSGVANLNQIKDSYYDTYAFRFTTDLIKRELGILTEKFSFDLARSRCAFMYGGEKTLCENIGFHIDEHPVHLLRCSIPLKTSDEYVLEINGSDDFGNSMKLVKHLEVGKAYIWNTRIPHKVYTVSKTVAEAERIHLILGLMPWIEFADDFKAIVKNQFYGTDILDLIENKRFVKLK